MGKILPVGLIIPTSIYLSPHASPVLVHRVASEWYLRPQLYFQHKKTNQNFTKGSKQEPYPSDRPLFNPVGPGTILNWPSGAPHATDLASKHHDYGYWQHFYIFLESLTMLDNIHLDATELAADHLFFWQPRAHSSTIFLPYTSASYPLVEHYNARLWQQILIPGRHWSNVSRSKVSIYKELPVDLLVQSSSERDPSLPYPSFSCYPPKSKFDLELSSSHPTSYGISHSQIRVLLSLHRLTFCHLFSDSLDWLTQLIIPNETQRIFFHNSHWYAYSQDRHNVYILLKNTNDPLLTFLTALTSLNSSFHTLSFFFYYAPPTPRGLCGLVAISSLCCLLGLPTQLPAMQPSGYALQWSQSKAVRELHVYYARFVAGTNKHFSYGPVGYMDNEDIVDSHNNIFNITDTMSPQVPSLHPDIFSIPLIPPNFSHEPITYNLHLTDSELVDFLDIQTIVDQRFVYFHFDQFLFMNYFHLKDTTSPPQLFSSRWDELYPCYPQSCIRKILLWDNFLQTWDSSNFAQVDRLPQTSHLRIHFHTKWLQIDFPLTKRSFRIEITPLWTVQHVIESLQTTLGHTSTPLILTQQGRALPHYFDPWRALPSYTLKPLPAKIPPTPSTHQGRQLAKPLRYCTCNTWCATTHELTRRALTSFGNPQINICIFRHPVNNHLFVLPICSITTPTHIHARFLPYNAVFWIPVVNDTFVSMDSILIHYGTPVALEFYEFPLTRGIHTDTLYGTSLFHLRIQDPGTMTYRPYKRIILQPNPHLHRFIDIALIIEPTLTVEELELTLENFLRLNSDCLQPPRSQPTGTLVSNTVQQTYQILVGEDPYAI